MLHRRRHPQTPKDQNTFSPARFRSTIQHRRMAARIEQMMVPVLRRLL
jgi:hypothetical protein